MELFGGGIEIRFVISTILVLSCLLRAASAAEFRAIAGPCELEFPGDHASHPEFRTEWWYYTGNLHSDTGEHFGFQLTFFRIKTNPGRAGSQWSGKYSEWRTDQVFAAHAAVTDISGGKFHFAEKMSRAAVGLAGASSMDGVTDVFVGGWRTEISHDKHRLSARTPDFSLDLELISKKPPVLHGDSGYTKKGETVEEASCYYSLTRLEASGKIIVGGRERAVSGTAWMDHEFSSAPLDARLAGWDWFSLQLDDGSEVMIYLMREKEGGLSPVSSGTYVDVEGKVHHLSRKDIRLEVGNTWKSPHTGASYPSFWIMEVVPAALRLEIRPRLADQEVQSPGSTRITYWEGSVELKGVTARGLPIAGHGYVEMTGYAGPVDF